MTAIIFVSFVALFIWCCSVPDVQPCIPTDDRELIIYPYEGVIRIDVSNELASFLEVNGDSIPMLCKGGKNDLYGYDYNGKTGIAVFTWVDYSCEIGRWRWKVYEF